MEYNSATPRTSCTEEEAASPVQNTGSLDVEKAADHVSPAPLQGEALDWLGRPATEKHGGFKTSIYILVNQALWNVANYAVAANLVLYFKNVLQMGNATAANNVTNWFGTMWLLTLLGGFAGDCYWGRFWTCVVFQIIHILGLVGLSLTVTLDALKPTDCTKVLMATCPKPTTMKIVTFFVSLYVIALGSGGYLPAFTALGADQFESDIHKTTFFGWNFFSTNVGNILATTLFVSLENAGMWALSYWLATGLGILAFLSFGLGVPFYRQFRPAGNPVTRVSQVLVASLKKWKLKVPNDASLFYELDEQKLILQGCRKMCHTPRFRFLDKAATKDEGEKKQLTHNVNGWRLCSTTQVEEVKQLWRLLPIFLSLIPISAIFSQGMTLFVEQAAMMNTKLGSFHIPPAAMSVVCTVSMFVMTILYPLVAIPIARTFTGRLDGLSPLQRMVVGQIIASLSMALAAMLESRRLHLIAQHKMLGILWQTPQQVVVGIALVFVVVGGMDFFYNEAPHSMRGLVSSFSFANLAIGNYASTILVTAIVHFTSMGGRTSWIPPNLNNGHLDYVFLILFALCILSIVLFLTCAWWYHRTPSSTKAFCESHESQN